MMSSPPDDMSLQDELMHLRRQHLLFKSILAHAPILISAKDLNGNILFTSQQFDVLRGPGAEEYVHRNVFELFPKEIADELWKNDLKAQQSEAPILTEESVYHRDGTLHTYQTCKFRLLDEQGQLFGTCAVSFDITHLKQLEHDVQHDPLTGLYNRRTFNDYYENELHRAERNGHYLALALIDLDGFKQFNDFNGHASGDDLLCELARTLKHGFRRPGDYCFRLGGDEFAVLFETDAPETALMLLNACRETFNEQSSTLCPGSPHSPTLSAGVRVVSLALGSPLQTVFSQADAALYQAKHGGRNQCVLYRPGTSMDQKD